MTDMIKPADSLCLFRNFFRQFQEDIRNSSSQLSIQGASVNAVVGFAMSSMWKSATVRRRNSKEFTETSNYSLLSLVSHNIMLCDDNKRGSINPHAEAEHFRNDQKISTTCALTVTDRARFFLHCRNNIIGIGLL